MKKLLAIILSAIFALSCIGLMASGADAVPVITVSDGTAESADAVTAVRWWQGDNGEYFFFLPDYWQSEELTVWFSGANAVKLGETDITSGEVYDLGEGGVFAIDGKDYKYTVLKSGKVGSVFITTESGSLDKVHADKNYKEAGSTAIFNDKGKSQYEGVLEYIKGRGNASWQMPKRPYNIKLDKKAKLFGMEKSKKWCLIANMGDNSLMRNAMVFGAAADAGLRYTPGYAPVDLYVNNEYMGSYLLTTKVEAAGARIDVEDLDELNEEICIEKFGEDFDMDDITVGGVYGRYAGLLENTYKYAEIPESEKNTAEGGYILEMEIANRYSGDLTGFVTKDGQPFVMKSPEYASEEQIKFISSYYQQFEDAVLAGDEKYADLIDTESFAMYYDITEWTSNMDTGLTSTYFYLDTTKDGILYAGPVWDYDIALGNNGDGRYGLDYNNPELYTVCHGRQYRNTVFGRIDIDEKPTVFNALSKIQSFVDECKAQWDSSVYEAVTAWSGDSFDAYASDIEASAIMEHIRWKTYGTQNPDEVKAAYEKDLASLKGFASKRTEFINGSIGKIQENPVKTNIILSAGKKILTGINNLFEKFIVLFHLENKG